MNEKQVTLSLTVNQLNVVLGGLVKLPIEVAMETFTAVQQQAQQQLGQPTGNVPPDSPLANKVVQ